MKILFVDDDTNVLQGLKRMLYNIGEDWEMKFVGSGADALRELERGDYNTLITDFRMPGMDGHELLSRAKEEHPNVVRIVLSGHAEVEHAVQAVALAHQYLVKPCESEVLLDTIKRSFTIQSVLADDKLKGTIGEMDSLPSVPKVYMELTEKLKDPNSTAEDVAKIVSQDQAMVSKMLQLVNSSFFVRGAEITSPKEAVIRLGLQMVRNLVLSVEVFSPSTCPIAPKVLEKLQRHALQTGAAAAKMFKQRKAADEAFLGGMLHDVGKLILLTALGKAYVELLKSEDVRKIGLYRLEKRELGFSHAEAGAYLLGIWGLPTPVVEAVAHHHSPQGVSVCPRFDMMSAVYLANCLVSGDPVDDTFVATLGVEEQLTAWKETIMEMA